MFVSSTKPLLSIDPGRFVLNEFSLASTLLLLSGCFFLEIETCFWLFGAILFDGKQEVFKYNDVSLFTFALLPDFGYEPEENVGNPY